MTVEIDVSGLAQISNYMALAPRSARTAARLALNTTADRKAVIGLRAAMEEQVAFPKGYLNDPRRFGVTQRATDGNLEAVVTARSRPTSLARFASNAAIIGNRRAASTLTVRVNPGRRRALSQAFLIRLRAGQGPVQDGNFNLGLAVRLRKGEVISNKVRMVPFGGGLYLLYGPSVDQVFRGVASESGPEIADFFAQEFFRQFVRLTGEA